MKKFTIGLIWAVAIVSTGIAFALTGTSRILDNYWFPTNRKIQMGAPNSEIYYDGTNLVLDVTSGGGKVSIPDGMDLGTSNLSLSSSLVFEGATADAFETTISITDPTADRTITIPDASGVAILGGNTTVASGANTACNTTCGASTRCIAGQDADSANVLVACNSATADVCICSAN